MSVATTNVTEGPTRPDATFTGQSTYHYFRPETFNPYTSNQGQSKTSTPTQERRKMKLLTIAATILFTQALALPVISTTSNVNSEAGVQAAAGFGGLFRRSGLDFFSSFFGGASSPPPASGQGAGAPADGCSGTTLNILSSC